jgi:hypothetical protein
MVVSNSCLRSHTRGIRLRSAICQFPFQRGLEFLSPHRGQGWGEEVFRVHGEEPLRAQENLLDIRRSTIGVRCFMSLGSGARSSGAIRNFILAITASAISN